MASMFISPHQHISHEKGEVAMADIIELAIDSEEDTLKD